jgi:arsenate reductase-like glutaredoxin family protein
MTPNTDDKTFIDISVADIQTPPDEDTLIDIVDDLERTLAEAINEDDRITLTTKSRFASRAEFYDTDDDSSLAELMLRYTSLQERLESDP